MSREYVNLVNCFKISHLIIPSLPLHPSLGGTWTWSIALRSLIWLSHPILFIRLQLVRELIQFLWDLSSNYPIPSTSSVSRKYVNLANCFKISHLINPSHPLHPSPVRTWTWLIVFKMISHRIIPSHPLHPSPGRTWTWSIVLRSLIWLSNPILFIRFQEVRKLGQWF